MANFAADILEPQDKFKKAMMDANAEAEAAKKPASAEEAKTPDKAATNTKAQNALIAGIKVTEDLLSRTLKKHNISEFSALGQKFDPALHEAIFEYQDPSKTPGTVGVVVASGYKIGKRILRAPRVGVVKK
jgi:molecular chaperone GrpE